MTKIFVNGICFTAESKLVEADVLVVGRKIVSIGQFSRDWVKTFPVDVEIIECKGKVIAPGLIDPHLHLSGGSGEGGGFFSQSLQVLVSECVQGAVTSVVGTLGVDTTTKTMPDLIAKVKAYNEIGMSAYAYVGGYDLPPKTITGTVRNDLIFIPEIIGVGEISIADGRAPEPDLKDLARASIDAHVGGMLTGKAGITHFHVGDGARGLKTIRDLMEAHVIDPSKIYLAHIERNDTLVREGIELARKGSFVDFDIYDRDLHKWYKRYLDAGGPKSQLTVSSDAGVPSVSEMWDELRNCVLKHEIPLADLLPHFTSNTAQVLKLKTKGRLEAGADADIIVFTEKDMELNHVIANGQFMLRDGKTCFKKMVNLVRRGFDIYEGHKN